VITSSRRHTASLACAALVATALVMGLEPAASGTPGAAERGGGRTHWKPGIEAAKRYARSRAGEVSFAFIGLHSGYRAFHGGRTNPMASLYKAMLLAAYLHRARDRGLHGWEKDLLNPMIRRSDNNAASTIDAILGRGPIEALADRAHMRHFEWNDIWGLSRTSAGDQARFFHDYHDFVPKRHEAYAMRLLRTIVSSQRWGVAQVRPDGWNLYFKGGWGSGTGLVDHQSALLRRRHNRIGLSVMTDGNPNHAYGMATLRGVAGRLLKGLPRVR
jgi:hypothetical protein